jgi:methionine-rich copper-binding protein CopC
VWRHRSPAGSQALRLSLAISLISVLVLLQFGEAAAHAFPDHSDPRVGSTVERAPSLVQVWFDGEIEPVFSTIRVESDDKKRVDKGDARVSAQDGRLLEVSVDPLPPGQYRVYWSVVARDGHRTEGDFRFRIK